MRVGYLSCFSPHHTEVSIADALEAHFDVERYHFRQFDVGKFLSRKFDLVLTAVPANLPPDFWRRVKDTGAVLVAWYFDWIRAWNREAMYLPKLECFDLVLSTDGSDSKWYEERGIKRRYLPQACDTSVFRPLEPDSRYACDVAFVGHAYGKRATLMNALKRRFDFRQFGQSSEAYGPIHAAICNSAKIMVADSYVNDCPGYWSNRVYLEVGSGGFVLHPRTPGLDRQFVDGRHLVTYEDDLIDKIEYYLRHDDERRAIADAGWRHVHANHSYEIRVGEMCELVSSLMPT